MRWFRDNIGQGSRLALLALVINLGLSFGHVHAIEGKCTESSLISLIAALTSHNGQTQGHSDEDRADHCPICTAAAALASPLAFPPPPLPVDFAGVTVGRAVESVVAVAKPPTAAFQSRGPPIS